MIIIYEKDEKKKEVARFSSEEEAKKYMSKYETYFDSKKDLTIEYES